MIDKKKIQEAQEEIFEDRFHGNGQDVMMSENDAEPLKVELYEDWQIKDAFEQGANWALNEFMKGLWHDASEEPEKNKLIIEEYLDEFGYDYELDCPTYSGRTWVEMVKVYGIRKWCYLDDILPKKGDEG